MYQVKFDEDGVFALSQICTNNMMENIKFSSRKCFSNKTNLHIIILILLLVVYLLLVAPFIIVEGLNQPNVLQYQT